MRRRLGPSAPEFAVAYDVRPGGNWEGRNVLRRLTPSGDEAQEARLAASRAKLFAIRQERAAPPRDDKVLADWNGLMIAALARASAAFAAPEMLEAARAAFASVWNGLRDSNRRLAHSGRMGRIGAPAMLDDYAALARAALALFQATGSPGYLEAADLGRRRGAGPVSGRGRRALSHRHRRRRRALGQVPHLA